VIELAGREADVVLDDVQDTAGIKPRGLHRAGVNVPHALRHAGRARRIEPERDLIAARLGGGRGGRGCQQRCEILLSCAADRNRCVERCNAHRRGLGGLLERRRDEQRLGAGVLQDVAELLHRQQRVERDRDDAGADRTPEQDREIDRVEHDHRDAIFPPQPEAGQHRADARDAVGELRIGDAARVVREGDLAAATFRDIAVDHVDGCVVGPFVHDLVQGPH
jgi:hypothetical protein